MPDERLAFPNLEARGAWRSRQVHGMATLFVEAGEVVVRLDEGAEELAAPWEALSGAGWRGGALVLHAGREALRLTGSATLDRAWMAVQRRACTLPEVTRGLRTLGSPGGGAADDQQQFFAPILQARRRLEAGEPLDWQVAAFDAQTLGSRLRGALTAMAAGRFPDSPPHRRALEAELADAAGAVFARLAELEEAAHVVRQSPDAERFVAWRRWAGGVRALFVAADQGWRDVAAILARHD